MLFNFVPIANCCWLTVASRSTVPDASSFLVGLTGSVAAKINLADSTSRNSIGHLLVSVAGASDPVCIRDNRSVDLERTDCQPTISDR